MNKQNAHLYLPLVQALAEGKTVQLNMGTKEQASWSDREDPTFGPDPSFYRIKPASFPPLPEGVSWHNPDGLTAEQVGDGWRLLVVGEARGASFFEYGEYLDKAGAWSRTQGNGKPGAYGQLFSTVRVPIYTPFPDGSYLKDGKLVKPWKPKFKVGDRVKVLASTYDTVKETEERIGQEAVVIEDTETSVDVRFKDNARWSYAQSDLELSPWSLSRHIPGFRPLRDGEEWHRTDWTEEMLEGGWRPLLLNEREHEGDEDSPTDGVSGWSKASLPYVKVDANDGYFTRTRRPLPEPPKHISLGPSDVPPGSVFKLSSPEPYTFLTMNSSVVYFADSVLFSKTWEWLKDNAKILRPGQTEWQPCYREVPA